VLSRQTSATDGRLEMPLNGHSLAFSATTVQTPKGHSEVSATQLGGSARPARNLLNASRAMASGAWPGIAKTELTLISHKT
jgi:hypothetical protein